MSTQGIGLRHGRPVFQPFCSIVGSSPEKNANQRGTRIFRDYEGTRFFRFEGMNVISSLFGLHFLLDCGVI